jgi:hypothetical protein
MPGADLQAQARAFEFNDRTPCGVFSAAAKRGDEITLYNANTYIKGQFAALDKIQQNVDFGDQYEKDFAIRSRLM